MPSSAPCLSASLDWLAQLLLTRLPLSPGMWRWRSSSGGVCGCSRARWPPLLDTSHHRGDKEPCLIGVVRAVSGTVNLALQLKENAMGHGMTCRRRDHAAMATPVTPAQVGECLV